MLIDAFHKNQTEIFIETLPDKEKKLVENYIDLLINHLALEGIFISDRVLGWRKGIKVY